MLRHFTDDSGVAWRVWDVEIDIPDTPGSRASKKARPQHGWLVFESPRERRRFSPIPADWTTLDDAALIKLCARADSTPTAPNNFDEQHP